MPDVLLFVEDVAQEAFLRRFVECLAQKDGIRLTITVRSAGGYGRVLRQLQDFVKHWKAGRSLLPDGIVVAVDANCRGYTQRRDQVDEKAGELKDRIVHAIPDPHIERWFLLDGNAFKKILGRGCQAPDDKCEKSRYKRLLAQAVVDAGVQPSLGGVEYARDLADTIDVRRACDQDPSFNHFVSELRTWLNGLRG